jgi:phosphatidylserine decarboxylase
MVVYGYLYGLSLAAAGLLVTYLLGWPWALPFYLLALFCFWFFRDPERAIPAGPVAVSPADGKVVLIKQTDAGQRLSIFLNVFDVHVNRAPVGGRITQIDYHAGKFLVASREQASTENERNTITVEADDGTRVTMSQIAGLIARRIICYKRPGDSVATGERVGLIKFGSRVDVFFGPEWEILAKPGERVSAGSSILARRRTA